MVKPLFTDFCPTTATQPRQNKTTQNERSGSLKALQKPIAVKHGIFFSEQKIQPNELETAPLMPNAELPHHKSNTL